MRARVGGPAVGRGTGRAAPIFGRLPALQKAQLPRFALIPIFASKIQKNTLVCAVHRKKSAYLHRTYKTSLASSTDSQKDMNLLALGLFGLSIDDANMRPEHRFRHPDRIRRKRLSPTYQPESLLIWGISTTYQADTAISLLLQNMSLISS